MRSPRDKAAILVVASIFALCLPLLLPDASLCAAGEPIGKIAKFVGVVWVRSEIKPPVEEWVLVKVKDHPIYQGDAIRTERGRAEILFLRDDGVMRVVENTELTLRESEDRAKGVTLRRIFLILGKVWANVVPRRGLNTQFESNAAVAGLRGCTIFFWVDENGDTWVLVTTEGVVDVTAGGVTVTLTAGQATRITPGGTPSEPSSVYPPPPPTVEELEITEEEEELRLGGAPPIVVAPAPISPATGGGGIASPSD